MQTIIGMAPHIMVIGIPQAIMLFIMSQQHFIMSMLIMPIGIIVHIMPLSVISILIFGIIAMPQQLIIGMPLQFMPQLMPLAIMLFIIMHIDRIISMLVPSAGIIMHIMPLSVIEQLIWHIIGIMPAIGIGMFVIGMFVIGIFIAVFIDLLSVGLGN